MSREFKIKLATVAISGLVSLYLAEIALTLLNVGPSRDHLLHASIPEDAEFDRRVKAQVVADMRERGEESHPALSQKTIRPGGTSDPSTAIVPLGGISGVTTVYCNESGKYTIYESDRYGFRNPDSSWSQPADVLMVGDSFSHGACVGAKEEMAEILRGHGLRTISVGWAGNGPLRELGSLKEYGPLAKPQTVLWLYYEGNDPAGLEWEHRGAILKKYLQEGFSQHLSSKQELIDEGLLAISADTDALLYRHSKLYALEYLLKLTRLRHLVRATFGKKTQLDNERFVHVLAEAKRVTQALGAELIFVYLPEPTRFSPNQPYVGQGSFRDQILATTAGQEIPVIDLLEVMAAHEDKPSLMPLGSFYGHYGPEGYKLVADTILSYLKTVPPED